MKKTLTVLLALVLVIAMSVAGTMAYLTDKDTVTNTFTVGNVAITMDEKDTDNDDNTDDNVVINNETRDQANSYKLIPGHTYTKDPIVRVTAGSEDCWLFVKVTNEIAEIEDQNSTVASQMKANGWTLEDATNNIYSYHSIVSAGTNVPVFTTFTIAGTVNNTTLATYNGKTIVVKAYAVQADNFSTASAALKAAPFPTT